MGNNTSTISVDHGLNKNDKLFTSDKNLKTRESKTDSIMFPPITSSSSKSVSTGQCKVPTLDFENMPFLRPPEESERSRLRDGSYRSPSLSTTTNLSLSPGSVMTEWNYGHSKQPTYHCVNNSYIHGVRADINNAADLSQESTVSGSAFHGENCSPVLSEQSFQFGSSTESSVSLQLSLLSQKANGSSPRSHRYVFSHSPQHSEIEIDANVPPPVPPHYVIPSGLRNHTANNVNNEDSQFLESALAEVDALEDETEEDINVSRTRPRSTSSASRPRSLSRSLSRSTTRSHHRSQSMVSNSSVDASDISRYSTSTEIYTRKCLPSEFPDLVKGEDDTEDNESLEPKSPEDNSFALDGYHEGQTVLRVVNSTESVDDSVVDYMWRNNKTHISQFTPSEKYRVKSKAQLAFEEERQRRRYARYGQPFKVRSVTSPQF